VGAANSPWKPSGEGDLAEERSSDGGVEPPARAGEDRAPLCTCLSPSELLASPGELLASPGELLASPSELLASPGELLASPSELLASPSELLASPS
jgi:hypothetical protein